ncbi:MAG: O-antigen ligase family protein [Alphaproteobacteria bacterium]
MRFAFWLLVGAVALAPLPFASNRPWAWSLLGTIVAVALIAWAIACLRGADAVPVAPRRVWVLLVLFAALLALFAVQAVPWTPVAWHHPLWAEAAAVLGRPLRGAISLDPAATTAAAMRFATYGAIFWIALQGGRARRRARAALLVLVVAGFGYCAYGLFVDFSGANAILWFERWAYQDSVTSTFVNRNAFASYAGIVLIVTLGRLVDEAGRAGGEQPLTRAGLRALVEFLAGRGGLLVVGAATAGFALLFTDSRGGLVSVVFALVVLALLVGLSRHRRPAAAIAQAAAVATLGLVVVNLAGDVALDRLARTVLDEEQRLAVYESLARAIVANPWTGVGLGSFATTFSLVRDVDLIRAGTYLKAHNGYLEWAFEGGVPALALIVLLIGSAAAACVAGALRRRRDAAYPGIAAAVVTLVAVHSLVDFGPQTPAVAATVALVLGIGCAQSWREGEG